MSPSSPNSAAWEAALPLQRARLVRYCRQRTGNPDVAEDLAQETLYEAWRHLHKLHEPEGFERWLGAIARNVCRRWAQDHGHDVAHRAPSAPDQEDAAPPWEASLADEVDLDVELERAELIGLLDRALALLPEATRQVLVQRYVAESPQADVARRLGVSEGAIEARLQRGKLALRRVLTTRFPEDAAAYGLVPAGDCLQATRLWCPGCGQHYLDGRLDAGKGELFLCCPRCTRIGTHAMHARMGNGLQGLGAFKPAAKRVLRSIHDLFQTLPVDGVAGCLRCGARLPIQVGVPPFGALPFGALPSPAITGPWPGPASEGIYLCCARCGFFDNETWYSLAWSLEPVRRFWQEHPRMRFLPAREFAVAGRRAMRTGVESMTGAARVEVVLLRDTGKALFVDGAPPHGSGEQ